MLPITPQPKRHRDLPVTALVVIGIFITLFFPFISRADAREYTIVRAPQKTTAVISRLWLPYVNYLSKETGFAFRLKVYNTRAHYEADLAKGKPDFFFANALYMLRARAANGYIPLLRSGVRKLRGIIVVRKDAPIKGIRDLNGMAMAFPSPKALGASVWPRALMEQNFGISFIPSYLGTHDNVYRGVASGRFVAGGGITRTLEREHASLRNKLRVLYTTPPIAAHPLSAHPRVPKQVSLAVVKATLKLTADGKGRAMLANAHMEGVVAVDFNRDYAGLEQMKLDRYTKPQF